MKKVLVMLLALLLLAGCTSKGAEAKVSNGDEVIFKGPVTYTKEDLNRNLKGLDYSSLLVFDLVESAAKNKGIDVDKITKDAEDYIEELKKSGSDWLINYYGGEESLKQTYVTSEILDSYGLEMAEAEYEKNVKTDNPILAQIAYFNDEESALKVIEEVSGGAHFEMSALENGYNGDSSERVFVDSDTALPLAVKDYLLNKSNDGLSQVIPSVYTTTSPDGTTSETTRYYVVLIVDKDVNNFKDEYLQLLSAGFDSNDVINYVLSSCDVKFYDQRTYELMTSVYEVLK